MSTVRALAVVPSPDQPGLTLAESVALTLRRDATVSGRCICGAVRPPARLEAGAVTCVPMHHEDDCPAADGPHLEALAKRLGASLRYDTVVVEVAVA